MTINHTFSNSQAALLIIGDEVLKAQVQENNIAHITQALAIHFISVGQIRIVPDQIDVIAQALLDLMDQFDYVFCTGGIGPTHDDRTIEAVAQALSRPLVLHPEALAIIQKKLESQGLSLNEYNQKMAMIPAGASLLSNPIGGAPGFQMDHLYVLPGVPSMVKSMMELILPKLPKLAPIYQDDLFIYVAESLIAHFLEALENPVLQIGSYPLDRTSNNHPLVRVTFTSPNLQKLNQAKTDLINQLSQAQIVYSNSSQLD